MTEPGSLHTGSETSPETDGSGEAKGARASEALTERLLSSSGITAWVALVLSLATVVFMLWFRGELQVTSEVGAPTAEAAGRLDSSVSRSVAALRGWVAYADPAFIELRREQWNDIDEAEDAMRALAEASGDNERLRQQDELAPLLQELRYVQWAIEDVAQTPGNEPARWRFESELVPIMREALEALRDLRGMILASAARMERHRELIVAVSHVIDTFADAHHALGRYLSEGSEIEERVYRERLATSRARFSELEALTSLFADPVVTELATFAAGEARAYAVLSTEIAALRRGPDWSVSHSLFRDRALPLITRVTSRTDSMAHHETTTLQTSARWFSAASWLVVIAAFLLALVSGLAIFLSLRLRYRVRSVLSRVKKLGQYSIERKLGEGGMGQVYLARHALLRRASAVKLLKPSISKNRRARDRFRREVQVTSRLTHPNTIEIFDYGRTAEGVFYYAMEYVEGASLQALVEVAGPVPGERAVYLMKQVAGSLAEAHRNGLLHRDIKPANIMICERGGAYDTIKVLDFGLVREAGQLSPDGKETGIVGTPLYLAPEAILEEEGHTARSDIYAWGSVTYFLITGQPPFMGHDVLDILSKQIAAQPTDPSDVAPFPVPPGLERLILDCLAKDPNDRPADVAELLERLEGCESAEDWSVSDANVWWREHGAVVSAFSAADSGAAREHSRSRLDIGTLLGSTAPG